MSLLLFQVAVGIVLAAPPGAVDGKPGEVDGKTVVALLESIQPQLEDFRCEFEGTDVSTSAEAKKELKLKEDGITDSFGGVFIWKANGDTYLSSYHREEPEGKIIREQLAVRMAKRESAVERGNIDEPIGEGVIDDANFQTSDRSGSLGVLFALDKIRRLAESPDFYCTMTDGVLEGRPVKVVTFVYHEGDQYQEGGQPWRRFWIDLKRGGHAVREELYGHGGALWVRTDVKLASFRVGKDDIWMPISGVLEGRLDERDGKRIYPEAPTEITTIYVVRGTLEFNKHPGPEAFKVAYKPGTPISDNLRKLQFAFGQQKLPPLPSRREAAEMLRKQVDEAEGQRRELVAGSPARDGAGWTSWLTPALAGSALILSFVLLIHRRRH